MSRFGAVLSRAAGARAALLGNAGVAALRAAEGAAFAPAAARACGFAASSSSLAAIARAPAQAHRGSFALRGLASSAQPPHIPHTDKGTARDFLTLDAVRDLKRELDSLVHEGNTSLTVEHFYSVAQGVGAAPDDVAAAELLASLHVSGVVLRHGNAVFLQPDEVLDKVIAALPEATCTQARQEELDELVKKFEAAERSASFNTNMMRFGGLMCLIGQFGIFYWLTYVEYGWDIMEPAAYFYAGAQGILFYLYYMGTHKEFTWEGYFDRRKSNKYDKLLAAQKLDKAQYHRLVAQMKRISK
mmetsp:Transcript_23454/g.79842  ORF Transcript_23454/g.79842 Transcript_23454/m.79842 type:complete len:301 (-) Transcript_23454:802-1704(-)